MFARVTVSSIGEILKGKAVFVISGSAEAVNVLGYLRFFKLLAVYFERKARDIVNKVHVVVVAQIVGAAADVVNNCGTSRQEVENVSLNLRKINRLSASKIVHKRCAVLSIRSGQKCITVILGSQLVINLSAFIKRYINTVGIFFMFIHTNAILNIVAIIRSGSIR